VNLLFFSAPGTSSPFVDETLDVGLGFLANTDYTIFVVERRWADRPIGSLSSECLIGTDVLDPSTTACIQSAPTYQVNLAYVYYYGGYPTLGFESVCYMPYTGTGGPVAPVSSPAPSPVAVDMLRFGQAAGLSPTVWQNGAKINVGGTSGGLGNRFAGGAIGRAFGFTNVDERFAGDIAEIVIFDAALTDPERLQMEAYFKQHWSLP
jgi:hypothetical protein